MFKSINRAYRRGHLRWLPIEQPEEGQAIEEVEHKLFRKSKRGKWILYYN